MQRIDIVLMNLRRYAGEKFYTVKGKEFTYKMRGDTIVLQNTNRQIPRSNLELVLSGPFPRNVGEMQRLGVQGPSYLYALLTAPRIMPQDGLRNYG